MLEALSPAERTAFVLHDVFGHSFAEVADAVGRTPQASRQLASRARRHVQAGRPRFATTRDEQREVVAAFAAAVAGNTGPEGRVPLRVRPGRTRVLSA